MPNYAARKENDCGDPHCPDGTSQAFLDRERRELAAKWPIGPGEPAERMFTVAEVVRLLQVAGQLQVSRRTVIQLIEREGLNAVFTRRDLELPESQLQRLTGAYASGLALAGRDQKLWTVPELVDLLRISKPTIYRMLKNGQLHGIRVGKQYRVPDLVVRVYIEASRYASGRPPGAPSTDRQAGPPPAASRAQPYAMSRTARS